MKALSRRLDLRSSESGLSLIEVIIAMMVFALIATGVGYTMIAALRLTQDSTARQQAANLASQEIDLTRSIDNLFNLVDKTTTQTINGITYTIKRTARWVSDPNVDQRCGVGGGILRYKRVNVSVAWTGMTSDLPTVRSDTLIDPGVRINDPDLGTVLISVSDSSGEPVAGASVNVSPGSPSNGANPLASQPPVTDSLGCTYALMVDPGNYNVTVSKSGYVDITQDASPSVVVSVEQSSASAAMATLDLGANVPDLLRHELRRHCHSSQQPRREFRQHLRYEPSVRRCWVRVTLFPFPAGYEVLAGMYNDPATSLQDLQVCRTRGVAGRHNVGSQLQGWSSPDAVAAIPGGTAPTATIPMGVVSVTVPNSRGYLVRRLAESLGRLAPQIPGAIHLKYDFGRIERGPNLTIALPFGTWKLYTASSSSGSEAS